MDEQRQDKFHSGKFAGELRTWLGPLLYVCLYQTKLFQNSLIYWDLFNHLLTLVEDKTEGGQTRPLSHLGGASPHQSPSPGAVLHTPNSLQPHQLYNSTSASSRGAGHHHNKYQNNMVHNISQPVDQLAYGWLFPLDISSCSNIAPCLWPHLACCFLIHDFQRERWNTQFCTHTHYGLSWGQIYMYSDVRCLCT